MSEYIRVHFTPTQDEPVGERVWVEPLDGDDNEGLGTLLNQPVGGWANKGDIIRYEGGHGDTAPEFVAVHLSKGCLG